MHFKSLSQSASLTENRNLKQKDTRLEEGYTLQVSLRGLSSIGQRVLQQLL